MRPALILVACALLSSCVRTDEQRESATVTDRRVAIEGTVSDVPVSLVVTDRCDTQESSELQARTGIDAQAIADALRPIAAAVTGGGGSPILAALGGADGVMGGAGAIAALAAGALGLRERRKRKLAELSPN